MAKKKTSGKKVKRDFSLLMRYRMKLLQNYVKSPKRNREEQNKRKEKIAKIAKVSTKTLKSMYLNGQGLPEKWDRITECITEVNQKMIIKLLESSTYLKKIKDIPKEKVKLLKNIDKLSSSELSLLNEIIEIALKANKLGTKRKSK